MPISVGYSYNPQGVVDLASIKQRQEALEMQKQEQAKANIMAIVDAFMKVQGQYKQQGLLEREMKVKEQPKIDELWNAATISMMQGNNVAANNYLNMYYDAVQTKYSPKNKPNQTIDNKTTPQPIPQPVPQPTPQPDFESIVTKYNLKR